jgi:membrane-bound lytic murein transglycosylase D
VPVAVPSAVSPTPSELIPQEESQDEGPFDALSVPADLLQPNISQERLPTAESPTQAPKSAAAPAVLFDPTQRTRQSHEPADAVHRPSPPKAPAATPKDRLLDWVERDLNKAVQQPVERRRLQFSKPVIENPRVRHFIRYFSNKEKDTFATALARSGKYVPMIAAVLREEGLPEEFAYLALIESYFSPHALSPSGAVGLWQFMAATARQYGLRIDAWVDERRDPIKSTHAAAAYLKDLHEYFDRWYLATAAYNAGQGAIERMMQSSRPKDFAALIEKSTLSRETRNFVPKFVAAALVADNPSKYGFGDIVPDLPREFEEIEVRGNLSLADLAHMAGTERDTLRELNPALVRGKTPPGDNHYRLRLPAGHAGIFEVAYRRRQAEETQVVTHQVKKGETLFSIARRYGQQVRALMELNGLTDSRLRIGQKLTVILEGLRGRLR